MTTPAGWYLDPDGTGGQRYWNGESWTEHRAPAAVEAPPGSAHWCTIGVSVIFSKGLLVHHPVCR